MFGWLRRRATYGALVLLVSCGALGRSPAMVDEASVPALPAGFTVIGRETTDCRGTEDAGWAWRDLVVRADRPAGDGLTTLVHQFEVDGFRFDAAHTPSKDDGWYSRRGSNGSVGLEIGSGTDYAEFGVIIDQNPAVAAASTASGDNTFVVRLKPENVECMI
jgi:hypothetical protein